MNEETANIFPKELPILILRDFVLFPTCERNVYASRTFSSNACQTSINNNQCYIVCATQKNPRQEDNFNVEDLYEYGTLCRIINTNETSKLGSRVRIIGLERVKIRSLENAGDYYFGDVEIFSDVHGDLDEEQKLVTTVLQEIEKVGLPNIIPGHEMEYRGLISLGTDSLKLGYFLSDHCQLDSHAKIELLSAININERFYSLLSFISKVSTSNEVDRRISDILKDSATKYQKEYILRERMKAIQKELGDDDKEEDSIKKKLEENPFPKEVKEKIESELKRKNTLPPGSLEGSLITDYIDVVMDVPWYQETEDNNDIKNVIKVLDEDHYGLKKVKERIVEYLAVKQINQNLKAPILCFYGPPGCGKTSLSKSIARALNRKFIKCSLGGVSDEAEIRGHRRTYVGSRPGRIISLLRKVGVKNPVFLLDEIDKLGRDGFKGEPSSALLEVLDPEQNFAFNDNYLELPYDLSKVLFICTANDLSNIPTPLMDRLELIEVDSYTLLDKIHIAKDFLILKEMNNNGVKSDEIEFLDDAIAYIIERYTRESGVRDLERKIASILRKFVVDKLNGKVKDKVIIDIKKVKKYLGLEIFEPTDKEKGKQVGVVTGLAYTPFGGDILPIEVNYFKGKGQLILTGKLGDVMKESCTIALDYVKANATKYNIDPALFEENDIHIHVPEGAVSKDGPSAGCAITTAILSCFTKIPVSGDIAMTGEVTLRGNALPIGGLREKTLAALRSGIKKVIIPSGNKKDVSELPKEIKDNLEIIYMKKVDDAVKVCLEN